MKGFWIECRENEGHFWLWEGTRPLLFHSVTDRMQRLCLMQQVMAVLYGWA